MKLHLLPNAHLDPVWLWDWREGLTEAVTTVRTVLGLMDEFPELTFLRGESLVYEEVQRRAPDDFRRVRRLVEQGRWDVVGGTYIQPDTNLASTETLCRQFEVGLDFFRRELGVRPTVAWQADCFGHTPGWPRILRAFGMTDFAYFRPQQFIFPLDGPAFWWGFEGEPPVLCYRPLRDAYCCERGTAVQALESIVERASKLPHHNVAVFFGLGNHGGGPTRRQILDLLAWRERHPEHEVVFSTLHGFFADFRAEAGMSASPRLPVIRGEIGHCLRGVYSSAQRFKSCFRRAEDRLVQAETTAALVGPGTGSKSGHRLDDLWTTILFNSFHDILPGTSIERAMAEQENAVRGVSAAADEVLFDRLAELAGRIDTSVPEPFAPDRPGRVPVLLWNPSAAVFRGLVEIEVPLDYRMVVHARDAATAPPVAFGLWQADGEPVPFQEIETENDYVVGEVWRKRVVAEVEIPGFGWRVVQMGLSAECVTQAPVEDRCATSPGEETARIENPHLALEACVGAEKLAVLRNGSGHELSLLTVADPFGSWGDMRESSEGCMLDNVVHSWRITEVRVMEEGPLRSRLWVRMEGGRSMLEWTFDIERGRGVLRCGGRLLWNEKDARLQWIISGGGDVVRNMPAAQIAHAGRGQVPFHQWWQRQRQGSGHGLASDVLGDADFLENETRVTLARSARFATGGRSVPGRKPWRPPMDQGVLDFDACLFFEGAEAKQIADRLRRPPVIQTVSPSPGELAPVGSLASFSPAELEVLAMRKVDAREIAVRLANFGGEALRPDGSIHGTPARLDPLDPGAIRTDRIAVPQQRKTSP